MRQLSADDAQAFYELNNDPEVIRYTGDTAFQSVEHARTFLENYNPYQLYGTGRMAVINKVNNCFLGWCGLKYTPETAEYDIGFRFFRAFWNKGLATEAADACLQYGFQELKVKEIIGRAVKVNTASIRVLEKIGLSFRQTAGFHGMDGVIYGITSKEFNHLKRS